LEGWWAVSYVALWVVVGVLCVIVVALARQIGTLHLRLGPRGALELDDEGPALGKAIDPLEATAARGERVTIAAPGRAQMLLFVSPACPVCEDVLPAVSALSGDALQPVVLTDAPPRETASMIEERRLRAPVVSAPELTNRLGVPGTPYVLMLDGDGVVRAKGTVNNLEQIEGLVYTARSRLASGAPEARAA
jgi:methylamine dehydrogenase accessory protein MauD